MDRISALRNVEDALADFEDGDATLEDVEHRVLGVLRTYVTDFEGEDAAAFRATGDSSVAGVVVVAPDAGTARERIAQHADGAAPAFDVERVD